MAQFFSKTLLALTLSMAATALCAVPAFAVEAKKPIKAKSKSKAKSAAAEEGALKGSTPEDEPDVTGNNVVHFSCELNNTVTVYSNENDNEHIAVRWKKRLHRLTRVGTTTGAQRFENRNFGLIWIGIPAKGMLLDSRQNRQLANECKSPDQAAFVPQAPQVKPASGLAPLEAAPVLATPSVAPVVAAPALGAPAAPMVTTPPAVPAAGVSMQAAPAPAPAAAAPVMTAPAIAPAAAAPAASAPASAAPVVAVPPVQPAVPESEVKK